MQSKTRHIFEALQRRDLCPTLERFSTDWLGRSHSYVFRNENIAPGVAITLWWRLHEAGQHDLAGIVFGELVQSFGRGDEGFV